jgi:DNA polymerase-3 subunit beta
MAVPGISKPDGVILSRDVVETVAKLDGEWAVSFSKERVAFKRDNMKIIGRLVDGTFPDYNRVIPQGWEHSVKLDGVRLRDFVKKSAWACQKKLKIIKICGGTWEMSNDNGSVVEELGGVPGAAFGLNADYLADVLEHMHGDVTLHMVNETSPMRLDDGNGDMLTILMPMRA